MTGPDILREPVTRVLIVEDDEEDFLVAREMLARQERTRFRVEWCARFEDALRTMAECRHDVYLVDLRLGARTGLDLIRAAFAHGAPAPVLVLTGESAYEADLEAEALGVADYLVKQELDPTGLERAIRYAIRHGRAIAELSRSQERYALAVRAANDGIWDWDVASGRIYLSPRWYAILGLDAAREPEVHPDPAGVFALVHPADAPGLRDAIAAHLAGRTPHLLSEHRMRHADGGWRWVMSRGLAIRDPDGRATRMAGSLSDVTDRRIAQLRLRHDALHDALTGLPNRTLFLDRVGQTLRRAHRDPDLRCAVLFIDLDRFKLVNDSLSHAVGDELLVGLAARLGAAVRPGDTVARLGGDEFTALLEGIGDAERALEVARRILAALAESFHVDGHELFASASVGIALSEPGTEAGEIMRDADIAMYDAKRRGRGRCSVFDASMRRRVVERLTRETELRHVVESSLLGIHYQPIVDLRSGAIRGLEALARWPDAWSPVAPSEFIQVAEETGQIGALGEQVLHGALGTLADWRADGLIGEDVCVSVNLSGRQLEDPAWAEGVRSAINSAALPPQALKLEITESTFMEEVERTRRLFAEVTDAGVGLHLDDFGTGYSSLSALHRFPVDALKIDRSFVAALPGPAEPGEVIVRSTVALAHSLGLPVIAEGIESREQLRHLRELGCEFGQGYLFGRALDAERTRVLLAGWDPERALALGAAG